MRRLRRKVHEGSRDIRKLEALQEIRRLPADNLLIGCGVRCGGVSDGVAIQDEFDAAIALAAFGGVIRGDRLRFSEAPRGDG